MCIVGFTGLNEIGSLRFTESKLFSVDASAEQFVDEPEPISVENVTLAVLSDFGYPACLNHSFDFAAIDSRWFARQADDLADLIELDRRSGSVGAEHVAEIKRIFSVAVEVRSDLKPRSGYRLTIALYHRTGRSKLWPLNVMS
jgi:hypothetical protein